MNSAHEFPHRWAHQNYQHHYLYGWRSTTVYFTRNFLTCAIEPEARSGENSGSGLDRDEIKDKKRDEDYEEHVAIR
ncbi:hypothetical protein EVAR_14222_1 [Eumeta japonica]|uniref:Uncharacterized protein n=1 Tax=Eumeta variegata TaxID=151549 RepID=A0A4C1UET0_EUMVA|nr:hypothetical protein EVAR_14222_1 [Eumeta japonica]